MGNAYTDISLWVYCVIKKWWGREGRKRKKKKHSRSRKGGGGANPHYHSSCLLTPFPPPNAERGKEGKKPFRMILSLPARPTVFYGSTLGCCGKTVFLSLCPGLCLPSEEQNRHHGPLGLPSTSTFFRPPRMFSARFVRLKVIRPFSTGETKPTRGEKARRK